MTKETNTTNPEVFRWKRDFLQSGLILAFVFGIIGICVVVTSLKDPPVGNDRLVLFFVAYPMCLLGFLYGGCFAIGALRWRLIVDSDKVTVKGFRGTKWFRLSEIASLDWGKHRIRMKVWYGGKVLTIAPELYAKDDFDRIVYLFRTGVPEDRQENWCALCYFYSRKSRGGRDPELDPPDPSKGEVLMDRRRWDRFFGVMFLLSLPLAVVAWFFPMPKGNPLLYFPLFVPVMWLPMRFSSSKKGIVSNCIFKKSQMSKIGIPFLFIMPCLLSGMILIKVFPEHETFIGTAALIAAIPLFCWFFVGVYQMDLCQKRQTREEIERFAVEGNLFPEAVFGHLDGGGKNEVELED